MSNNLWDQMTGEPTEEARASRTWRQPKPKSRPVRDIPTATLRPSQQKPGEVSENVWGLAEQFLEQGKTFFGRNVPVNRAEFSKRLSAVINDDRDVKNLLAPWDWNEDRTRLVRTRLSASEFAKAVDRINDVVSEMINVFWANLEAGAQNSGGLQFRFLDDDWAQLWYVAETNLEVRKLVKGLETGETNRVEANYRQVSEESREVHRMRRLQIRLRRQTAEPERKPVTEDDRSAFRDWVAERKRTHASLAN